MSQCVTTDWAGRLVTTDQQQCDYVLLTQTEFQQISTNPLHLSVEDATLITPAILLCWAAGWGIRQIVLVIRKSDSDSTMEN